MCEALKELMKDDIAAAVVEAVEKERIRALAEGQERGLEKGLEEGLEKGLKEGTDNALLSSIINLMDTMKLTAEQAMDAIKIPLADRDRYTSRL